MGVVCRLKMKAGLRHSQRDLHSRTRLSSLLKLSLDSSLKTTGFHSIAVQSRSVRHHSKQLRQLVGVIGSERKGRLDTRCPSDRCLAIVREDTEAPSEGAACVWRAANGTVASTHAYRMM
ncbi:uncharacterized protein TNCV_1004651 [Trichonephila clavipes]|nr:uncharacterized protein TNCV_1004651 [Trichonephila clavipes]